MLKMKVISSLAMLFALNVALCKSKDKTEIDRRKEEFSDNTYFQKYSKIEIYCWCFLNGARQKQPDQIMPGNIRVCNTIVSVSPSELIKPEGLFDSITNGNMINGLEHMIFYGKKDSVKSE